MKRLAFTTVIYALMIWPALGQTNIKPAVMYQAGEHIYGARSGAASVVPQGWVGLLPRDSEIFLLMPANGLNGEIYVLADSGVTDAQRKQAWLAGLELDNGNVLRSDGKIFKRNGNLASFAILDEPTEPLTAYIESQCGPYGYCLSALLLADPTQQEELLQGLYAFMDSLRWQTPNGGNAYAGFNWHDFLAGKHLINYAHVRQGKDESDLWLCADGTFTTRLKRTGLQKGEAGAYKGTHKGTWQIDAVGDTGILRLNYEKLPPLEVEITIKDDRVFINGKRFLVIRADNCR